MWKLCRFRLKVAKPKTVIVSGAASPFGLLFILWLFFSLWLQAHVGELYSPNDFLSSASALRDPAEWQAILIPSHKGKQSLLQPLVSLFFQSPWHTAFNTLIITQLKLKCSAPSEVDDKLGWDRGAKEFLNWIPKQTRALKKCCKLKRFTVNNVSLSRSSRSDEVKCSIIVNFSDSVDNNMQCWEPRLCLRMPFILLSSSQLGEGYPACFPTQTPGPICSREGTTFVKDSIMALASLL